MSGEPPAYADSGDRVSAMEQLQLTGLWPCTTCDASGRVTDPETGLERVCPTCQGAATLEYDPLDLSEIPY